VLAIAAALVGVEGGTLLVDEVDTGLYYGVLTDVWRLILETSARLDAQVFSTTHSWDCVRSFQDALATVSDGDLECLIRLERDGDTIQPVSYSKDELEIAIQQDIEVR
jgi:ABC-type transporter Mla maintaining outer membrane lipid asymmetry ATPase subunit MlaF